MIIVGLLLYYIVVRNKEEGLDDETGSGAVGESWEDGVGVGAG